MLTSLIIINLAQTPPVTTPAEFPLQLFLLYLALFCLGIAGSALFSGIETACYTTSRLRLFLRESAHDSRARIIHHEIENLPRLISTLLIGNNIANYLLSFAITAILSQILKLSDWSLIALQALVLTPFLFIFVETLPKEFFRSRADRIIYPLATLLRLTRIILTIVGLLPFIQFASSLILRLFKTNDARQFLSARARMSTQLHESVGQGLISTQQINIVERSLKARDLPVSQIMTPWSLTEKLETQTTRTEIKKRAPQLKHSRYPVLNSKTHQICGTIALLDLLFAADDDSQANVNDSLQPVTFLNPNDTVPAALNTLKTTGAWLAVVGSKTNPQGIVTRKDLLNPLLGTITTN